MIAGLIRPDRGSITLDGRTITGPGPDRGVVFQNYSLLPWMTAFEKTLSRCEPDIPPTPCRMTWAWS
jgi:ABC-type taurine transport system ATPase subunit